MAFSYLCKGVGVATLLLASVFFSPAHAVSCPACGDANCDGTVDAIDALLIAQVASGVRADLPCAGAVDVSGDSTVNITDALRVGQFGVGLLGTLACSPVVSALVPRSVTSSGGDRVRIAGTHFSTGAGAALGGTNLLTTYIDCQTLEVTVPRGHPASVPLTVRNADGLIGQAPLPLVVEGSFEDVTAEAHLSFVPQRGSDLLPTAGGVAVGDFDHDGLPDIFVPNSAGPNALFRNLGDGTFQNVAAAAGLEAPTGNGNAGCFGDFDNDGDVDLYVTNRGPNRLYRNNGNGTFTDITNAAGVGDGNRGTGCAWGDFDRDGFLDLFLANHLDESDPSIFSTRQFGPARRSARLFHNMRDGRFEDGTFVLGNKSLVTGAGFGAAFVDYDNDGDPDLYAVNDFGREIQGNVLWRNGGPAPNSWLFANVATQAKADLAIFGMGLAIGDYDGDGFFDFYVTNIGDNVLLHARGDGTFEDLTTQAGAARAIIDGNYSVGWGDAFFDYDNDGNLDLYFVAGYLDSDPLVNDPQQPNVLFRNRGNATFENVSDISGSDDSGIGRGVAIADFNNDGFLDMVIVNLGQGIVLLRNTARSPAHWLEVDLVGTHSNRDGIGARLTAVAGSRRLIREVIAGGTMSQHALTVHFGLGPTTRLDALEINWPSGTHQTLNDVATNQRLVVQEP